jgi:3-phenylpropionate/cinnamic acid dioxygenase small subunit
MGADRVDERTYLEVTEFLLDEAELLDNRQFEEWLAFLTEDMHYSMPVRETRSKGDGPGFVPETAWFSDTKNSLKTRIRRLNAKYPVAEDPPSRTRHFVSNIRAKPGQAGAEVEVKSNLLLYRSRGNSAHYDLFSAERKDILRRVNGSWKLANRTVLLDQTILGSQDISVFL